MCLTPPWARGTIGPWGRGAPTAPRRGFRVEGENGMEMEAKFPECRKCSTGVLIPLSDYGRDGAPITYKAWVCTNPTCGFNVRIDNGEISLGRAIGPSSK